MWEQPPRLHCLSLRFQPIGIHLPSSELMLLVNLMYESMTVTFEGLATHKDALTSNPNLAYMSRVLAFVASRCIGFDSVLLKPSFIKSEDTPCDFVHVNIPPV